MEVEKKSDAEPSIPSPGPGPVDEPTNDGRLTDSTQPMSNLQLSLVILGLWVSLFLCSLETTIVSTSLVHISDDFNDLSEAGWIVVVYLLTFNAFILIWSKLSDTFGTKWLLLSANLVFCIFSIACAVSKTMVQLIIFRAFQGIGGSGMYSLVFVVMAQIVPMDKIGICSGILSSVFALASLLGPILGGVISDNMDFLAEASPSHLDGLVILLTNHSVPGIAVVFAILGKFMTSPKSKAEIKSSMKRMDIIGALLSLAWAIPLIFALQEGGQNYPWKSGTIIGTLVTGVVMFVVFVVWESWAYRRPKIDNLFPVALLKKLTVVFMFLTLLMLGFTFYVPVIQIPQRFQHVNNTTATRAGILLLPLTLVSPCSALCAGILVSKHRLLPPIFTVAGACIGLVGTALMSSLPVDSAISHAQYGYQVLLGISIGLMTPSLLYLIKVEVEEKDLAGAMGVSNMGRTLGGCIGLAVCNSLLQVTVDNDLAKFLDDQQRDAVRSSMLEALKLLTVEQRIRVGEVYGDGYNLQFKALIAFSGLCIIFASVLLYASARPTKDRQLQEGAGNEEFAETHER
ncbi:hypothetical protein G7046_g2123 [Stylonectria norvegica]|nr:hypothetical protein G7046_g2123 [Stylonectria norvegica]